MGKPKKPLPPLKVVQHFFSVNSSTGDLIWNVSIPNNRIKPGDIAGSKKKTGYIYVNVPKYGCFAAHRIIFLLAYKYDPFPLDVHHIDLNRSNNKPINLEPLTTAENNQYKGLYRNNSTGYPGVSFSDGRYRAYINFFGEQINVGFYLTALEAHKKRTFEKEKMILERQHQLAELDNIWTQGELALSDEDYISQFDLIKSELEELSKES